MTKQKALISIAYFPPISYFAKFFKYDVLIEKNESYKKQTYRNRMHILGSQGVEKLIVPIKHKKRLITDIEIDYSTNWQKVHLRTIKNYYSNAAFFIFYFDDLIPIFEKKHKFLFDLNLEILNKINELLNLGLEFNFTSDFVKPEDVPSEIKDFRYTISPKISFEDEDFEFKPYHQVFNDKFGFVKDLSILDLIFNLGPEAKNYLIQNIKQ